MAIGKFGWVDGGPPAINAANLEAMLAMAGAYADSLFANVEAAPNAQPALAFESGGSYPLRSTVTASNNSPVMWIGPDAPPTTTGYALNDIDLWVPTSV